MRNCLDAPGFEISQTLPRYPLVRLRHGHRSFIRNREPKPFCEFKAFFPGQLENLGDDGGHTEEIDAAYHQGKRSLAVVAAFYASTLTFAAAA